MEGLEEGEKDWFLLRFKILVSHHVKDSHIGMEVIIFSSYLKEECKEGHRSLGFWFMDSQSKDKLATELFQRSSHLFYLIQH